jgi:predicted RNA binding protein YcfA (HicA-like mRNA interferase family)
MKLPRDLSGRDLIAALSPRWGYAEVNQVGSHVILPTAEPTPHRIAVPAHKALRVGTLNGILLPITRASIGKRFSILCKSRDKF